MAKPPIAPERTRPIAERIYREHYPQLLSLARRAGAGSEAEDVVSRALELFIGRYDPEAGSPALAWLKLTIKREAWSIARKRARLDRELLRPLGEDAEVSGFEEQTADLRSPDPQERLIARELSARRAASLQQLKPHERTCLGLHGLGYTYKEIQAMKNWSHTKVNRLMAEGGAALRKLS
jgi:RNA polymerase sigma factor (sigma-70 family)